jgi:hypothetical protein
VVANRDGDGDGSGIKLLNNIFEIWDHHESSESLIFFYFERFQFLTFDSLREKKQNNIKYFEEFSESLKLFTFVKI